MHQDLSKLTQVSKPLRAEGPSTQLLSCWPSRRAAHPDRGDGMAEMGPRWGGRAKHPCMSWDMHQLAPAPSSPH